ncbi:hypothetical protein [Persicirhabdus sediminis]|uniref:Uncharacterized protein n=1 Tax=Persicirhabdus sediminis TaxID=454144 RepID=A0A8J7MBZ4_9BACT|nr:hypothetical protein [Persicirhabdus sediminis]MBK1790824.1 hypothetical protein [Persicirhabdus sediminis]
MAKKFHDYDALPNEAHAPRLRTEMKVVAVVVIFVLVLEIVARFLAPHLDYDRKHIHAFDQTLSQLESDALESGAPRVVFFGNSLMMHGLKPEILHDELDRLGGLDIETAKITPVGTAMLDWVYLYQRYFEGPEKHPDVLVVGFVRHHIYDQEPIKLRRLSRHFVASQDLPELWQTDLPDFHSIVQSSLCSVSALCGDQELHQRSILYCAVPDYSAGVKRNNRIVSAAKKRHAQQMGAAAPPTDTFQRMERFITACKERGVKLYFVPMPQPKVWPFNPAAAEVIENHGMQVLDARQIEGMDAEDFSDGYHLGESGGEKFSRWLAGQLKDELD